MSEVANRFNHDDELDSSPAESRESPKQIEFKSPTSFADPFITIPAGDRQLAISACHQLPERSIHFRGRPIICYRCAGTYGAVLTLIIYQFIGWIIGFTSLFTPVRSWFISISGGNLLVELGMVIVLHLPMVIDGGIQAWSDRYESTNWLRMITGILAGIGQVGILLLIGSIYFAIF